MVGRSGISTGARWTPPKVRGPDHRVFRHAAARHRGEARQERHHCERRRPPRPLASQRWGARPEPRRSPCPPPQRRPPGNCRRPRPALGADLAADGGRRHALRPTPQRQCDRRRQEQAPPEHPAGDDEHDRPANQAAEAPSRDLTHLGDLTRARRPQNDAAAKAVPVDDKLAAHVAGRDAARHAVIGPECVHRRYVALPELDGNGRVNDTRSASSL